MIFTGIFYEKFIFNEFNAYTFKIITPFQRRSAILVLAHKTNMLQCCIDIRPKLLIYNVQAIEIQLHLSKKNNIQIKKKNI